MMIYGVCISSIRNFNEEKFANFLKFLYDEGYMEYLDEYLENRYMKKTYDHVEYSVEEWVEDFESNGYFGLSAFLKEIMSSIENLEIDCEDINGVHYLGIRANTPWAFSGKTKNLTKDDFCNLMSNYISEVCDDDLEIKWWYNE